MGIGMRGIHGIGRIAIAEIPEIGSSSCAVVGEVDRKWGAPMKGVCHESARNGIVYNSNVDLMDDGVVASTRSVSYQGDIIGSGGMINMIRTGGSAGVSIAEVPEIRGRIAAVVGEADHSTVASRQGVIDECRNGRWSNGYG